MNDENIAVMPEPDPMVDDKRYAVKYLYQDTQETMKWGFIPGLYSLRAANETRKKYLEWYEKVVIFDTVTQSDVHDSGS